MLSRVLTPLAIASVAIGSAAVAQDQPPIEVWLDQEDGVRFGEAVRVYVRTAYDGHVLVLHADPQGNIDILFPIEPVADDFARGGRAYEVRGPQNREAFVAGDAEGAGVIYAAYSQDPFLYTNYSVDGRWDTRRLGQIVVAGDAEDEMTFLVQQMASGAVFDYDFQQYSVTGPVTYARRYGQYAGYAGYDPYYYDPFYYGPYYSGLSFGVHFGWGRRYRPLYYDPFYWDPFYDPFYYGYGYGYHRPWYRSSYWGCCSYWPRTVVVYAGSGYRVNRNYTFKSTVRTRGVDYRPRVRTEGALATSVSGRRGNAITSGRRTPVRTEATIGRRTLVRDASAAIERRTPARVGRDQGVVERRTPTRVTNTDRRAVQTTPRRVGEVDGRRVTRTDTPTRRSGAVVTTPDRRTATQAAPTRRSAGQADARRVRRPEASAPDRSRSAGATPQRVQRQPVSPTRGGRTAVTVRRPNGGEPATAQRTPEARRSSASAPRPSDRTAVPRSPSQRSVGGTPARPNRVVTPERRATPNRSTPVRARSGETVRRAEPRRANVRPQLQRRSAPAARPNPRNSRPNVRPNVRTSSGRSPVRAAPTRTNRSPVRSAPTRSSSGSSVRRAPTRSSSSSSGRSSSSSSSRRKKK
jgi:hypothetical protein